MQSCDTPGSTACTIFDVTCLASYPDAFDPNIGANRETSPTPFYGAMLCDISCSSCFGTRFDQCLSCAVGYFLLETSCVN